MNGLRMAALALIAGGALALIYGGFTYTKETHKAQIGTMELSFNEKETVNIPVWAGVGAIVVGGALLLFGSRQRP